jgi:hypothetical protein
MGYRIAPTGVFTTGIGTIGKACTHNADSSDRNSQKNFVHNKPQLIASGSLSYSMASAINRNGLGTPLIGARGSIGATIVLIVVVIGCRRASLGLREHRPAVATHFFNAAVALPVIAIDSQTASLHLQASF